MAKTFKTFKKISAGFAAAFPSVLKTVLASSVLLLASCASTPNIPEDATATQLIQMGQDALENSNYKAAEVYYMAVIQRYGTDTNLYIEARYELGHTYLQQKKYDEAYTSFSEILAIYENAEYGSVPGSFKKLAQIGMNNLPEKYQAN